MPAASCRQTVISRRTTIVTGETHLFDLVGLRVKGRDDVNCFGGHFVTGRLVLVASCMLLGELPRIVRSTVGK